VRLLVGPGGTTNDSHDARAAAAAAQKLIAGYRGHVHTSHYTVRYGGAPGVLIRGLPGGPALFAIIILAHQGVLYSIIAAQRSPPINNRRWRVCSSSRAPVPFRSRIPDSEKSASSSRSPQRHVFRCYSDPDPPQRTAWRRTHLLLVVPGTQSSGMAGVVQRPGLRRAVLTSDTGADPTWNSRRWSSAAYCPVGEVGQGCYRCRYRSNPMCT
jgi:hypothetical protein